MISHCLAAPTSGTQAATIPRRFVGDFKHQKATAERVGLPDTRGGTEAIVSDFIGKMPIDPGKSSKHWLWLGCYLGRRKDMDRSCLVSR